VTDAVGNQTLYNYDPASHPVERRYRGRIGGESPTNYSGAGNVNLKITDHAFDELGRLYQTDKRLFIPVGVTNQNPICLTEGPITPGDGNITTRYEYDRNSRRTFMIEDDMDTTR